MQSYLRNSWMWAEACALLDEAERKHRRFFGLLSQPANHPVWEPPTDIYADGAEIDVVVALPAARAEDVSVQLTASGLQIDAVTPPTALRRGMNVVRMEIPYGSMRRRIDLPPGRYSLIERHLDRGCLYLRLIREES